MWTTLSSSSRERDIFGGALRKGLLGDIICVNKVSLLEAPQELPSLSARLLNTKEFVGRNFEPRMPLGSD
jgi:hypothetical protein